MLIGCYEVLVLVAMNTHQGIYYICCTGGYGGSQFVEIIESYDPETNAWSDVSRMQTGRSGQGVTLGPLPDST